jgi:hypothetical protein
MSRAHRLVVALAAAAALGGVARHVSADEIAPELETQELRQKAGAELKRVFAGLADGDRRRLAGTYLAVDPDPSDPYAIAACDDDGDYVVVVSDAMLRLVANVARAQSYDEANGSRRVEEYASYVARNQIPGRRLTPPPPGFYTAESPGSTEEERLRESLAFVVARELVSARAGDLVCPHPTATKEHGDDEWTAKERRVALEGASRLYPGNPAPRDAEATARVLDAGLTERGALGLMRFFEQTERDRATFAPRATPTYLTHHPSAATRAGTIASAAQQRATAGSR